MEEFDLNIIYRLRRRHGTIDDFIKAYERMGDVSEDDGFLDVAIITI
jgi:heme-degrading monooxygenase HmoA